MFHAVILTSKNDRNFSMGLLMTGRGRPGGARSVVAAVVLAVVVSVLALVAHGVGNGGNAGQAAPTEETGVRLIMIEQAGCPYCARWEREIGASYPSSAEGRFAPLIRRPRNHPDLAGLADSIYSPTFIVVRDGKEVGRIVGYPGTDFFWGLLDQILAQAGFKPESSGS